MLEITEILEAKNEELLKFRKKQSIIYFGKF